MVDGERFEGYVDVTIISSGCSGAAAADGYKGALESAAERLLGCSDSGRGMARIQLETQSAATVVGYEEGRAGSCLLPVVGEAVNSDAATHVVYGDAAAAPDAGHVGREVPQVDGGGGAMVGNANGHGTN